MSNLGNFLILSKGSDENSRHSYKFLRQNGVVRNRMEAIKHVMNAHPNRAFTNRELSDILQIETNSLTAPFQLLKQGGQIEFHSKVINRTGHVASSWKLVSYE